MAMRAVSVTAAANHATAARLAGWSIREAAGTPAAATVRLRKAAVGGDIVAVIRLAASGAETVVFSDDFLSCEGGCFVEVVAGTVEGVLYAR